MTKPASVANIDCKLVGTNFHFHLNEIDNPGDQSPVILGGLYDEWGIEFVCEAQRRTQMIRFGTYSTKSWFNHEAVKDGHTALFPIPLAELQANENLKQNPGY